MDITSIILWAVVIWIVSQILLGAIDGWQIVKLQERVTVLKKLSDIIHTVKVETVGDIEYWYDADNDAFLAQGRTIDEVINVIKSRFPDHIFLIEDKGGLAAQTGWKLMPADEFQKLPLDVKNI
jgi:hypothetical protein